MLSSGDMVTYRDLLKYGRHILAESDSHNAPVLLCAALGCGRADLYMKLDERTDSAVAKTYLAMIDRRRGNEPVQYIVGSWGFMSLEFYVNESVLIPRQDTEILTEHAIEAAKSLFQEELALNKLKILDLCTGTGCVAVSLAHFLKGATVVGVDISSDAVDVARRNAKANKVGDRVEFMICDVFDDESLNKLYLAVGNVDILCSNPPYVPTNLIKELMPDVKDYEPSLALDGGEDGLDFYRRFSEVVLWRFVSDGGLAAFEVGAGQAGPVMEIMKKKFPDSGLYSVKDTSGVDRVVCLTTT